MRFALCARAAACVAAVALSACGNTVDSGVTPTTDAGPATNDAIAPPNEPAEGCMNCHNGSEFNDYGGTGLSNPHPFGPGNIRCTACHGGNGDSGDKGLAHVPPPPEIGDKVQQTNDQRAFFNRVTLTGIDKMGPYTGDDGRMHTGLDYLNFVNPGDLRVVGEGRGCGTAGCHGGEHGEWVPNMPFGNATGIYSGAAYAVGLENAIESQQGLYSDTAADWGNRDRDDPAWMQRGVFGAVERVMEVPEHGLFAPTDPGDPHNFRDNPAYSAAEMVGDVYGEEDGLRFTNRMKSDSELSRAFMEAVSITCGDCHLGAAGANNRYGDFRSSGCTACHMEYSPDGRSRSTDRNVDKTEPANPDAIAPGERAHVDMHRIRNVAKEVDGTFQRGISDYACAGCHQGSNRTVMQYWGIRLDQNQDVVNNRQYPANPDNFQTTENDDRLFDPGIGNNTFNGRNPNQYLLVEDYDGDNRDDTPEDVHYAAGMGCIDCHGSRDVHNGTAGDPTSGSLISRFDQGVGIRCESCHGGIDEYAPTVECETYEGETAQCAVDAFGNALRHVTKDEQGNLWMRSRLSGREHYVMQTNDVVVDNQKRHPLSGEFIFTRFGSFAMGRADGNDTTGFGPLQTTLAPTRSDFAHSDSMDCASCHSSWTNNCIGCHLSNKYNDDPTQFFFSNVTGERIVLQQDTADFIYQTPVPFYLGVGPRGQITQMAPGTQMFYRYTDQDNVATPVFAFSDRSGNGNNPTLDRDDLPSLGHDVMMPHSIRGRVSAQNEGPRYCVACHLTENSVTTFGGAYRNFRQAHENHNWGGINYNQLQQHIGQNTGNQLDSPFFVHMVAGLGTGLFLMDKDGCPINPLDNNTRNGFCDQPANALFGRVAPQYDLDGIVERDGTSNVSSSHPAQSEMVGTLRRGAQNPNVAGPLGEVHLERLADPDAPTAIILDAWLDANGAAQGNADALLN